jgi:hypothetical protein
MQPDIRADGKYLFFLQKSEAESFAAARLRERV